MSSVQPPEGRDDRRHTNLADLDHRSACWGQRPPESVARLRVRDERTSMQRALRLMPVNNPLAPRRQPQPAGPRLHDSTNLAGQPAPRPGIDGAASPSPRVEWPSVAWPTLRLLILSASQSLSAARWSRCSDNSDSGKSADGRREGSGFNFSRCRLVQPNFSCGEAHSVSQWPSYCAFGATRSEVPRLAHLPQTCGLRGWR